MAQVPIKRIEEAAQAYFQRKLNAALELSMDIPEAAPDDIDQEIEGSKRRTFQISAMLRKKKFDEGIAEQARELLKTLGVEKALPDALKYACQLVARAELLQNTFMIQELSGRPYDGAPGDPVFSGMMPNQLPDLEAAQTTDKLLGEAIEDYIAIRSKAWVAKTLGDQKRSLYLMRDIVGQASPLKSLNVDSVKSIRDALLRIPKNALKSKGNADKTLMDVLKLATGDEEKLSLKTADKYFSMIRSFLIWAEAEELISKVPGANVKVGVTQKQAAIDDRDPYSDPQLQTIFGSPLYAGCRSVTRRKQPGPELIKDAYYWVPLIALYSGMRLGEIVQLRLGDLKFEGDIPYFDVCLDENEDKQLKTAASERRVPVHPKLVEWGFLEHHRQMKKRHKSRIFEEVKPSKAGYYSGNFSKWWGRYGDAIGFHTAKTPFHSFRHNFTDAMKRADVPIDIRKELDGHSTDDVHSRYGSRSSVAKLMGAIEKISYETVETILKT